MTKRIALEGDGRSLKGLVGRKTTRPEEVSQRSGKPNTNLSEDRVTDSSKENECGLEAKKIVMGLVHCELRSGSPLSAEWRNYLCAYSSRTHPSLQAEVAGLKPMSGLVGNLTVISISLGRLRTDGYTLFDLHVSGTS